MADSFTLPSHCLWCGAYLMGGATEHKAECPIRKMLGEDELGRYGIEPDPEPRNSEWHRKIVSAGPIPNTMTGNNLVLECGHRVQTFGNLARAEGRVLCTQCRDRTND